MAKAFVAISLALGLRSTAALLDCSGAHISNDHDGAVTAALEVKEERNLSGPAFPVAGSLLFVAANSAHFECGQISKGGGTLRPGLIEFIFEAHNYSVEIVADAPQGTQGTVYTKIRTKVVDGDGVLSPQPEWFSLNYGRLVLDMKFDNDWIFLDNLNLHYSVPFLNGGRLLNLANEVARQLGAGYILLQDQSGVDCGKDSPISHRLALSYAARKGGSQSWYAAHGYEPCAMTSEDEQKLMSKALDAPLSATIVRLETLQKEVAGLRESDEYREEDWAWVAEGIDMLRAYTSIPGAPGINTTQRTFRQLGELIQQDGQACKAFALIGDLQLPSWSNTGIYHQALVETLFPRIYSLNRYKQIKPTPKVVAQGKGNVAAKPHPTSK